MGVSLNGGTPISHPKIIIFSRKTHRFVGETHHFRKPPYHKLARNKSFAILWFENPKKYRRLARATWNSWIALATNVLDIWWRTWLRFFFNVIIILINMIIIVSSLFHHHHHHHHHHHYAVYDLDLWSNWLYRWISSIRMEVSDHHDGLKTWLPGGSRGNFSCW